jgi:hypothetical protein
MISEADQREQVEYPACMMTLNFLTLMQKLLRSYVVVALAFFVRPGDNDEHFCFESSCSKYQEVTPWVSMSCTW